MRPPRSVAQETMESAYGPGSDWAEPNQFGESGFTRAQAESDIGADDIMALIEAAIELDHEHTLRLRRTTGPVTRSCPYEGHEWPDGTINPVPHWAHPDPCWDEPEDLWQIAVEHADRASSAMVAYRHWPVDSSTAFFNGAAWACLLSEGLSTLDEDHRGPWRSVAGETMGWVPQPGSRAATIHHGKLQEDSLEGVDECSQDEYSDAYVRGVLWGADVAMRRIDIDDFAHPDDKGSELLTMRQQALLGGMLDLDEMYRLAIRDKPRLRR